MSAAAVAALSGLMSVALAAHPDPAVRALGALVLLAGLCWAGTLHGRGGTR